MSTDPFEELDNYDDDVGLTSEDKKHAKNDQAEWFKGEKGTTYRVSLVYFHPLEIAAARSFKKNNPNATREELVAAATKVLASKAEKLGKSVDQLTEVDKLDISNVRFKKVSAHYKEGVGYCVSRLGLDGPEGDVAWKMMGDVKSYFTTVLLIYPTNKEGEVIKEQLAHAWTVKPWRIGKKVYGRLLQVAEGLKSNDLSIANQDLSLKCTNTDFQNFEIDGAGKALWRQNDKFAGLVLEKAIKLYDKLVPFREISTADLRIKLGLNSGNTGEDVSTDDYGDLLANV